MHKNKAKIPLESRNYATIFNTKITSTSISSVLRFVYQSIGNLDNFEAETKKFLIVTPNPEQVMRARVDPVYSEILNSADISVPDGIGLIAARKFLRLPTTKNILVKPILYFAQGLGVGFSVLFDREWLQDDFRVIRGRELFLELIKLANKKKWRVVLVGDRKESAQKALVKLVLNYKQINLHACAGPNLDEDANPKTKADREIEKKAIEKINKISPQLLFVGFGAPRQEKWLHKWWKDLKIGGAMVVGGTFNYVSGKNRLPPKWVADMGLEWLWRLFTGSQAADRVLKAFPSFALKVYLYKLTGF